MKNFNLIFLLLFFLIFSNVKHLYAQTYEVRIRQIKPDGPVAEATCVNVKRQDCFITLAIDPMVPKQVGDSEYLDMAMRFYDNKVIFNFLWDRSSAYAGTYKNREKGVDIFLNGYNQGYKNITLSTRGDVDEQQSLTIKETPPEWPLAYIEIGVRRIADFATE